MPGRRSTGALLAASALTFNAFVWGVSWWPFRQLHGAGLHPLWATALIYTAAVAAFSVWRPAAWRDLASTSGLWVLVVASGTTNAAFNWAVTIGDVVRVVMLFYLMPLWAVLLARLLLGERLTRLAAVRVLIALAGAAFLLSPGGSGWPWPGTLSEGLGLLGGVSFALNNVMLRREAARRPESRALAMFVGGALVSAALAGTLTWHGRIAAPPWPRPDWVSGALALAVAFLLSNWALQFGAARLRANATAVIMLTEVLFASVSALALGAGTLDVRLAVGGGLIVLAALLAVSDRSLSA